MNFLAHLLLSGDRVGVIMGNYAGDFVKGRLTEEKTVGWDRDYLLGVKLHRLIDSYTDSHEIVREAKHVVAVKHGKLAGIILDIYFDYFLAKNFQQFSEESLAEFSVRMYSVFKENEYLIPVQMRQMVNAMVRQDWLMSYATLEGIDLTFNRLSRRAAFLSPLQDASEELKRNEMYYCQQFSIFFPELISLADGFVKANAE